MTLPHLRGKIRLVPNINAAIKWVRQSERRRLRNLDVKSRLKTIVKKARLSGQAGAVSYAEAQLDRAAAKGIIHPNKAARKKSRLARAVAKLKPQPAVV